jgi:hypothetical protein
MRRNSPAVNTHHQESIMKNVLLGALLMAIGVVSLAADEKPFEVIAEFDQTPGNVAVSPHGRVFVSMHPFANPDIRVMEVKRDGTKVPYPNPQWAGAPNESGVGIARIIGIKVDPRGILWMVDAGDESTVPKVIGWDLRTEQPHRIFHLPPPLSRPGSFIQDLAIDLTHEQIYLADCYLGDGADGHGPAIIVLSLETGEARRVFENHPSVQAEEVPLVIDGTPVRMRREDGSTFEPRVPLNPIAIDSANQWVYYGSLHGTSVHRVRALALAHFDDQRIASTLQRVGDKPPSDGFGIDSAGNIYSGDLPSNGIGVTRPDGTYELLFTDPILSWVDGFAAHPDGSMIAVVNQLHRHAALNAGEDVTKPPYLLIKFKPLAPSVVGK